MLRRVLAAETPERALAVDHKTHPDEEGDQENSIVETDAIVEPGYDPCLFCRTCNVNA